MKARNLYLSLLLITTAACQPWPPYEREIRENFESNQAHFEELASKFESSKHHSLNRRGTRENESSIFLRVKEPEKNKVNTRVYKIEGGITYSTWEELADASNWSILLDKVGARLIERSNGGQISIRVPYQVKGPISYITHYIRASEDTRELKLCESTSEQLDCGTCDIELTDDWRIHYSWYQDELITKYSDSNIKVNTAEWKQQEENIREAIDQCLETGSMPPIE